MLLRESSQQPARPERGLAWGLCLRDSAPRAGACGYLFLMSIPETTYYIIHSYCGPRPRPRCYCGKMMNNSGGSRKVAPTDGGRRSQPSRPMANRRQKPARAPVHSRSRSIDPARRRGCVRNPQGRRVSAPLGRNQSREADYLEQVAPLLSPSLKD